LLIAECAIKSDIQNSQFTTEHFELRIPCLREAASAKAGEIRN
jgi:hypothetical protein